MRALLLASLLALAPAICSASLSRQMTGVPLRMIAGDLGGLVDPRLQSCILFYAQLTATPYATFARGSSSFTFTRNSLATYTNADNALAVAPVHEAVFSPDGYGVRMEPTEKNEVTYSEELENAAWAEQTATVYENASISFYAESSTSMDHVRETTDDALHTIAQEYSGTASKIDILSVFAKVDGNRTLCHLGFWDYDGAYVRQFFDLDAGTVLSRSVTAGGGTGASILWGAIEGPWADGSYRIMISVQTQADTDRAIDFGPALEDLKGAYVGNGAYGIYFSGAQVEANTNSTTSYMTSYIKTEAGAVTRAQDVLTWEAKDNLVTTANGTIVVTATQARPDKASIVSTTNDSNQQGVWMYVDNTLTLKSQLIGTSATADLDGVTVFAANTAQKVAMAWSYNDTALYEDQTLVEEDVACILPTGHTRIRCSTAFGGVFVRGIWVFGKRLTPWELGFVPD